MIQWHAEAFGSENARSARARLARTCIARVAATRVKPYSEHTLPLALDGLPSVEVISLSLPLQDSMEAEARPRPHGLKKLHSLLSRRPPLAIAAKETPQHTEVDLLSVASMLWFMWHLWFLWFLSCAVANLFLLRAVYIVYSKCLK